MKIGEFFINLGIKGTDKAVKATREVHDTLGDVKTTSLAAKAGILGMVYALERLTENSANTGATLMSYSAATGLSAETLQRWQYAARQANVGAEEMEASLTNLQSSMINMAMGKGIPAGMGIISNAVGIDQSRIRDTMYMMGKLAEYAKTEKNVDFANEQLKSFGLSLDMISAMRRGAFNADNLNNAPIYSDKEASQLQKVSVAWANLFNKFEMGIGHLNAKHGFQLVNELSKISDQIIKLIGLFDQMAQKLGFFQALTKVFEGWGEIFSMINAGAGTLTNMLGGNSKKGDSLFGTMNKKITDAMDSYFEYQDEKQGVHLMPAMPQGGGIYKTTNQHVAITNHLHGVKDSQDAAHHMRHQVQRAAKELQIKGQQN